jgi:hypothetical protein
VSSFRSEFEGFHKTEIESTDCIEESPYLKSRILGFSVSGIITHEENNAKECHNLEISECPDAPTSLNLALGT